VPHAGNSFERVDFIATVEEFYGLHAGHGPGKSKLFGFEFIVILAGLENLFEEMAVGHADCGADFKFRVIETLCFAQDAAPAF